MPINFPLVQKAPSNQPLHLEQSTVEHGDNEPKNERLDNFKTSLTQFLSETPTDVLKPEHSDFAKTLSNVQAEDDKLEFLTSALQAALARKVQLSDGEQHKPTKHFQLVNWALQQIKDIGSNLAVVDSINKLDLSHASDDIVVYLFRVRSFLKVYPNKKTVDFLPTYKALRTNFESPSEQSTKNLGLLVSKILCKPLTVHHYLGANDRKAIPQGDIKQLLKELPYFAREGLEGSEARFNYKIFFEGQEDEEIACRHFSAHRIETQATNEKGKFRVDGDKPMFCDLDAVPRLVKADMEQKFERVCTHAEENYLICNADFGKTLIEQFKEMGKHSDSVESTRYILLTSENHAMSLKLRIKIPSKAENGLKLTQYVVEFYDPNFTNNHIRFAHTQPNTLHNLGLKDLFGSVNKLEYYENYYPENNEVSMLYVTGIPKHTQEIFNLDMQINGTKNRTLANKIDANFISPIQIWHLMLGDFSGTLKELAPEIKAMFTGQALFNLLAAKDRGGAPGLHMALQNGNADTIQVFEILLEGLSSQERFKLLEAKSKDGDPGLFMALMDGHAEAIQAYGTLLQDLSPEQIFTLLEAKSPEGYPGFYGTLYYGHTDAIQAYGNLLELLPEKEDRIKLFEAKGPGGDLGILKAKSNGYTEAVKAYEQIYERLLRKDHP